MTPYPFKMAAVVSLNTLALLALSQPVAASERLQLVSPGGDVFAVFSIFACPVARRGTPRAAFIFVTVGGHNQWPGGIRAAKQDQGAHKAHIRAIFGSEKPFPLRAEVANCAQNKRSRLRADAGLRKIGT